MAEFSDVPIAVAACTTVSNVLPCDAESLCLSPEALSDLLSSARNSNAHTKPPQVNDKVNKKTLERLQQPLHPSHLHPFLRMYMHSSRTDTPSVVTTSSGTAPVATGTSLASGAGATSGAPGAAQYRVDVLQDCVTMCVMNDPDWVYQCQQAALKFLLTELAASAARGVVASSSAAATATVPAASELRADDPVLLAQLRRDLPQSGVSSPLSPPPMVSIASNCHLTFVVDTSLDDTKDRYFSGQVRFKCESKAGCSVRIAQRLSLLDGRAGRELAGDFQCFLDKSTLKKGDTAVLVLSLIAKPYAEFLSIEEVLVVVFDDVVPCIVTFTVTNPAAPPFGTALPHCVFQPVQQSPIGPYAAPLMLQLLKHVFIRQQGLSCKDVAHLLYGYSHIYGPQNRDVMRQAVRLKTVLDDVNIGDLLSHYWTSASTTGAAGAGIVGTSRALLATLHHTASPSTPQLSHRTVPPSLSQPAGYAPGAVLPSPGISQASLATFPNVTTQLPDELAAASPAAIFAVMLLWIAEFPMTTLDSTMVSCDPMTYFETLQPWQQGIMRWVIDLCCGLLQHRSETEVNARSLALTFAAVLLREPVVSADCAASWREQLMSDAEGEEAAQRSMDEAWRRHMQVRLHAVTALVHWISLYAPSYAKMAA